MGKRITRAFAGILSGAAIVSCSAHVNSVTITEQMTRRLDPLCAQDAVRSLPQARPSTDPEWWWVAMRVSGDTFWDNYDFSLPEIENLSGPKGRATYSISHFFHPNEGSSQLFTSVVWTEPSPQSEATAARLTASLHAVRDHLVQRCVPEAVAAPKCERRYANKLSTLSWPCKQIGTPNTPLEPTPQDGAAQRPR